MSAMRSASSMTSVVIVVEVDLVAFEQVDQAAGSRDRDLDAAPQVADLPFHRRAAVERGDARADFLGERLRARRRPAWRARASARARARWGARVGRARRVCSIGRPKASVLPEPVWALPQTSRPASASSMVACLDGEGLVDALGREGVDELGAEAEVGECGHAVRFLSNVVRGLAPFSVAPHDDRRRRNSGERGREPGHSRARPDQTTRRPMRADGPAVPVRRAVASVRRPSRRARSFGRYAAQRRTVPRPRTEPRREDRGATSCPARERW